MNARRYGPLAVVPLAGALGVVALLIARGHPFDSFAGRSTLGAIAELVGGWSLVAAGTAYSIRHRSNLVGYLLAAAGLAWFLPELANPDVGSSIAFTVGFVGFSATPPLIAHAALAYPTGRLRSNLEWAAVAASYAGGVLLLGLLPATVFDPGSRSCLDCPRNLVLVQRDDGLFDTFNRSGLWMALVAVAASGVLVVWRIVRTRPLAELLLPVLVPALAYLGLVAWELEHSLARGILGYDMFDQRTWRLEAAALATVSLGIALALLRELRARASVARLVVELGPAPERTVREALGETLSDRNLDLAYRRADGTYLDASGRSVVLPPDPHRAITPLTSGGDAIAALVHDPQLLEQPGLLQEVLAAARLAVENERLGAEVRAQVEELRQSRARIVEAGDAERRRLERDLHDGAQQQLLALSYDLRLARAAATREGEASVAELLAAAAEEARTALEELRRLAHGIYPAILAEAGLGPALASLADEAPLPVELSEAPQERYSPAVETTVYFTIAAAAEEAAARGATFLAVEMVREEGSLRITARDDGAPRSAPLVELADRIGAIGGALRTAPKTLEAEIPCA